MKVKSVLLLSGGLDSAANLALCHERDFPILALTIRYRQKAGDSEVAAARKLANYYHVPHEVIELDWLGRISNSSLNQKDQNIPQLQISELDDRSLTQKSAQSVWVPNRNGVFIHTAAAYAESMGADRVVVGFNREEAATFPDNSLDYLQQVNQALAYSTSTQVKVFSYTVEWNKREIVKEMKKLSLRFPLEMIWSCYQGGDQPCERCESCQRLTRALS